MTYDDLLSLTCREEAATVYSPHAIADAFARAQKDFPNYKLEIAERGKGHIVRTKGMRVQRWLRA